VPIAAPGSVLLPGSRLLSATAAASGSTILPVFSRNRSRHASPESKQNTYQAESSLARILLEVVETLSIRRQAALHGLA